MRLVTLLVPPLLAILSIPLFAQGDSITRNPNCVQLKRIWKIEGEVRDALLGAGVSGVGDINGDGIGDFAVFRDLPNRFMVFYGSRDTISTTPVWTMDTSSYLIPPVVGDFWGTGHRAVGFHRSILNRTTSRVYAWFHFYRTDSGRLEQTPSAIWYAVSWKDTTRPAVMTSALVADLDDDGDDELIIGVRSVAGESNHGQIWIYHGGPDFQVVTPSIVITDPKLNTLFYQVHAGDIDGDRRVDLMVVKKSEGLIQADFYWGGRGWPSTGRSADRSVITGGPQHDDRAEFALLSDVDGDEVMDVVTHIARIWRSGSGKDPHTRDWSIDDADIYLRSAGGPFGPGGRPGYLNSKRYEMVGTGWSPGVIFFSGGPNGPDLDYDATYYPGLDGLNGRVGNPYPAGDVNGDGWDDAISGDRDYPDEWSRRGIAVIVAGGPYIPNDEPTVGVRQIALENRTAALSLWPNPVREELNIAWRGDLDRMPRRFEIHDMLGRLVSHGSVPDGDGAALWRCGDQPAGAYLLSVFDAFDVRLATTRFVKH